MISSLNNQTHKVVPGKTYTIAITNSSGLACGVDHVFPNGVILEAVNTQGNPVSVNTGASGLHTFVALSNTIELTVGAATVLFALVKHC